MQEKLENIQAIDLKTKSEFSGFLFTNSKRFCLKVSFLGPQCAVRHSGIFFFHLAER